MSNTKIGPWLGFVNSGRFKQKGFEKNHPVIVLTVGESSYGPACRVVGIHEWWERQLEVEPQPKFEWVKASGVSIMFNDIPKDASSAEHLWSNNLLRADDWFSSEEGLHTLLRMSHKWSSSIQTGLTNTSYFKSNAALKTILVEQGYIPDKDKEDEQIKFYGQVVRATDKAMLVSVGPDKEEHWFPKSQCEVIGYLTERPEQYILTTKNWQLRSKVGDILCETFVKAQKAIDKHGTISTSRISI